MAFTVTLNGVAYSVPEPGETGYGSTLTTYLRALATAFPQLGGPGALTAELDLGAAFGIKALYVKSETATPAAAGVVRLAKGDTLGWRNNANGADLALAIDASDNLKFNGKLVQSNPFFNNGAGPSTFVASETGINNALACALADIGGTAIPLTAGLSILLKLGHTLQAGANTLAINDGTAKSIKKHTAPATDLGAAYAATGAVVALVYDGTVWQDLSQ